MLKHRVIPTLLWKDVGLVKGVAFDSWRRVGTVLPAIKVYDMREVDELILLDITATGQGRIPDLAEVELYASECFAPLTIGGGVGTLEDFRLLLAAGADKVCVNTAAIENPALIEEAAGRFGSQCVVASIDARKTENGGYRCFSRCGSTPTDLDPGQWAARLVKLGAGEILITSIERDGTMQGYDLDLIRAVSRGLPVPVIASGGAGGYEDFHQALTIGGASAVAAASMYHFTQQTPLEAKNYLAERGLPVRNSRRDPREA